MSSTYLSPLEVGIFNYCILLGLFLLGWLTQSKTSRIRISLSEYLAHDGLRNIMWRAFVEELMIIIFGILASGLVKSLLLGYLISGIGWALMHLTNVRSEKCRRIYGEKVRKQAKGACINALLTIIIPVTVTGLAYGVKISFITAVVCLYAPHFFYHLTHNAVIGVTGYLAYKRSDRTDQVYRVKMVIDRSINR